MESLMEGYGWIAVGGGHKVEIPIFGAGSSCRIEKHPMFIPVPVIAAALLLDGGRRCGGKV